MNQPTENRKPRRRSPEEIVAELTQLVFGTKEPNDDMLHDGKVMTLTYEQFYELAGRKAIGAAFYPQVEWATWEEPGWWIIVGFGTDAVMIGPNANHVPVTLDKHIDG